MKDPSPPPFFKTDCHHFRPDRPCAPHKTQGVVCEGCPVYDPVDQRFLVLKVGAAGDVLRTTALLPALREKYPRASLTWVTKESSFPLFEGVAGVDRLLPFSWETLLALRRESFQKFFSLDFDPPAAAWAAEISAPEKRGFAYSDGLLTALNPEAAGWVHMSLRDDLKRQNRRTYQDWLFQTCGLSWQPRYEPQWTVTSEEKKWAALRLARARLPRGKQRLGLNTGAGGRWEQKKWTQEGLEAFLRLLRKEKDVAVLLLGGPQERERNRRLKKKFSFAVDTGCDNSLRQFGALVDLCDLVVTGDTLAMHIAVALRKRTVVFFGATSSSEIELYGRGEKVHKDWNCLPCYLPRCARSPHCMEALTAGEVLEAVRRQLSQAAAKIQSPPPNP